MRRFFRLNPATAATALRASSTKTPAPTDVTALLRGKEDRKSVGEFIDPHLDMLSTGRDMKGMFTSDEETIRIAQEVLAESARRRATSTGHLAGSFFKEKIFKQPSRLSREAGSIKVLISDIDGFPEHRDEYRKAKAKSKKDVMMCVGGPAAEDQTVLATLVPAIRERLDDMVYMTRDYIESNVNHSAKQSHARHGNALNADESLTGHALLPSIIMRKMLGVSAEEAIEPDFRKVDVKFTVDPRKLRIYFGNELNWMKQEYIRRYGGEGALTEHDVNRMEAVLSQEIMKVVEGQSHLEISGGVDESLQNSSSIHVTFTEKNTREVRHENEEFRRVGIEAQEMSPEERRKFFGDRPDIHSAFRYPGDTHMAFDTHEENRKFAEKAGARWIDGKEIRRILLTQNRDKKAEIAGVADAEGNYHFCSKLHFTGGYKVDYVFDRQSQARFQSGSVVRDWVNRAEDFLGLQRPLTNEVTVATGLSVNAIFKKSDRMKAVIAEHGSTGEIAITNSHWTMIGQNDDFVVMRMTGGGNTGSEEYNPSYFVNLLANTRRIFGDELVGVLSTYGCPRAVNARNATEFAKIAEGAVISYGKGGTGNTKRHFEAVTGLMMLGFDQELVEYFNQFNDRHSKPLGDEIKRIHQLAEKFEFAHDNVARTNRRMGYDKSLSPEESVALLLLATAAAICLFNYQSSSKKSDSRVEEIVEAEEEKREPEKVEPQLEPEQPTASSSASSSVRALESKPLVGTDLEKSKDNGSGAGQSL